MAVVGRRSSVTVSESVFDKEGPGLAQWVIETKKRACSGSSEGGRSWYCC